MATLKDINKELSVQLITEKKQFNVGDLVYADNGNLKGLGKIVELGLDYYGDTGKGVKVDIIPFAYGGILELEAGVWEFHIKSLKDGNEWLQKQKQKLQTKMNLLDEVMQRAQQL